MNEIYEYINSINSNDLIFIGMYTLIGWLIHTRIKHSVKHEYDQKIEALKYEQNTKQKSAVFAEFLAEWTHVGTDTKRLNQLLWELTLYLPSTLVKDMQLMISSQGIKKSPNEILVKVRNHLIDNKDPITSEDVCHFKHEQNPSMLSHSK